MTIWTAADQWQFEELQKRREQFYMENREPLLELVKTKGLYNTSEGSIVDSLIANADAFRNALAPFDSGSRAAIPSVPAPSMPFPSVPVPFYDQPQKRNKYMED